METYDNPTKNILMSFTDKIFYSNLYPFFVVLFVSLIYLFRLPLVGIAVIGFVASYLFFSYDDFTPIIPLLLSVIFIFSNFSVVYYAEFYIILSLPAVCFLINFFRFPIKKVVLGQMFAPLFIVSVVLFCGGIFSDYLNDYARGIISNLALGPLSLFIYFIFINKIRPPQYLDLKEYFSGYLVSMCFGLCIQLFALKSNLFGTSQMLKSSELGWANINVSSTLLILLTPSIFYLVSKRRHVLLCFILYAATAVSLFLTRSDGCTGIFFAFTPLLIFITYKNTQKPLRRKFLSECALFVICACAVLVLYYTEKIGFDFLDAINTKSNREPLYKLAISLFKKYPIFGVGAGYTDNKYLGFKSSMNMFNFHSTILHVLATMGIVGFIAYVYYFYKRLNILGKNVSPFNSFMLLSFIMFENYGLIDTSEFNFIPLMLFILFIIIVTEKENEKTLNSPLKINEPLY